MCLNCFVLFIVTTCHRRKHFNFFYAINLFHTELIYQHKCLHKSTDFKLTKNSTSVEKSQVAFFETDVLTKRSQSLLVNETRYYYVNLVKQCKQKIYFRWDNSNITTSFFSSNFVAARSQNDQERKLLWTIDIWLIIINLSTVTSGSHRKDFKKWRF